ncbi:MAG: VCBS repeat-containing protein, partial [bacterium]|nr:VCBS repeat-containing protein [bacterium]
EKVIAFDETGQRKWVFVSEMHPDVFRAAKTYWFKSAPGHEGIHGLHTGVFLDGKSQALVGSACTLEILDENGQLVERLPQFWGKVSTFRIVNGPGDTLDLLAARKYNGTHRVGVVNNETLNPNVRRFNSVPRGYTFVGGWSSMNRHHLFYEDFDGDGQNELMSEINGTWNRVTVWDRGGTAKYDASFGPGDRIPALNMRDIDIADLNGDTNPDIVVATARKMLIALTGTCEKLWARGLPSPPKVMDCITTQEQPWIVVGCEDGSVHVFDREGKHRYAGTLPSAPTCIAELPDGERSTSVLATNAGDVVSFAIP